MRPYRFRHIIPEVGQICRCSHWAVPLQDATVSTTCICLSFFDIYFNIFTNIKPKHQFGQMYHYIGQAVLTFGLKNTGSFKMDTWGWSHTQSDALHHLKACNFDTVLNYMTVQSRPLVINKSIVWFNMIIKLLPIAADCPDQRRLMIMPAVNAVEWHQRWVAINTFISLTIV
jgi:hypothetical protein